MDKQELKEVAKLTRILISKIEEASEEAGERDLRHFKVTLDATDAFNCVVVCDELMKTTKEIRSVRREQVKLLEDVGNSLIDCCEIQKKLAEKIIEMEKNSIEEIE